LPLPGERVDLGAPSAVPSERYRKFADSLLEEAGFEPSVPLRLARSGHVCRGVMGIRGRAGASHRVGRAGTRDRVRWPRCHAYDDRRPASATGTAVVRQVEVLW